MKFAPVSTETVCRCCAGDSVIYGDPCPPCMAALLAGDRTGHPHALSAAQLAAAQQPGAESGREIVDVLVATGKDGTRTVIDVDETSRRVAP